MGKEEEIKIEKADENRLLKILSSFDSFLQLGAFKRLVNMYSKREENSEIYEFLKNYKYQDSEDTNFLLYYILEFLESIEYSAERIRKISQKIDILRNLAFTLKGEFTQRNTLLILDFIIQFRLNDFTTCSSAKISKNTFSRKSRLDKGKEIVNQTSDRVDLYLDKIVDNIVELFFKSDRSSIQNISGKIILDLIKKDYSFDLKSSKMIRYKLDLLNSQGNRLIGEIKERWDNAKIDYEHYLLFLKNFDTVLLFRFINERFITGNLDKIEASAREIVEYYRNAIEHVKEEKAYLLEHLFIISEHSVVFRNVLLDSKIIDLFYIISESDSKESSYAATKILTTLIQ